MITEFTDSFIGVIRHNKGSIIRTITVGRDDRCHRGTYRQLDMVLHTRQVLDIQGHEQTMTDTVLLVMILLAVIFNGVMLWAIGQQMSDWINRK